MRSDYQYMLRLAVAPGHHESSVLELVSNYCKDACIDEVAFFTNCEELNTGHAQRAGVLSSLITTTRSA